jgi:hypothetical protein
MISTFIFMSGSHLLLIPIQPGIFINETIMGEVRRRRRCGIFLPETRKSIVQDFNLTYISTRVSIWESDRYPLSGRSRPVWEDFSEFFPDERDCLAAYLVLESAEVLEGTKPANLVNVVNRRRPCGRNLYLLWKKHGTGLIRKGVPAVMEMVDRDNSLLLFIYNPVGLAALLARKSARVILKRAGYPDPANLEKSLEELKSRLNGGDFPHEIGVFLGYPLKDVVGFMGWARFPFTCQGPWKIYGEPWESIRLAKAHRRCRCLAAHLLRRSVDPLQCLRIGINSEAGCLNEVFLRHAIENGYHYLLKERICA